MDKVVKFHKVCIVNYLSKHHNQKYNACMILLYFVSSINLTCNLFITIYWLNWPTAISFYSDALSCNS